MFIARDSAVAWDPYQITWTISETISFAIKFHTYILALTFGRAQDFWSSGKLRFTKASLKLVAAPWDWYLPHSVNCIVHNSRSTRIKPAESKNLEARGQFIKLKRVDEHINKSLRAITKFKEIQISNVGFSYKLGSDVPHRWCSTANCLAKF